MNVNLVLLTKDGSAKSFTLPSTVTSIGRRQDCDFCLPLSSVSRKHCEVNLDKGQVTIRDFGSQNGTYLNGQRIEEVRAKAGDLLKIGPVKFVIQIDGQPASFESCLPSPEAPSEKNEAHAVSSEPAADHINSSTTEMLEPLPDNFDLEASVESEFSKKE